LNLDEVHVSIRAYVGKERLDGADQIITNSGVPWYQGCLNLVVARKSSPASADETSQQNIVTAFSHLSSMTPQGGWSER